MAIDLRHWDLKRPHFRQACGNFFQIIYIKLNHNNHSSACIQRSCTILTAISMFSRSRNSMKLFLILLDASICQKSKMTAHKTGHTHSTACIQHSCTILTVKQIYSRHMSYLELFSISCDASWNCKSKMAAYKPEHWHLSLYKTYLQNNDSTHVFKVPDLND